MFRGVTVCIQSAPEAKVTQPLTTVHHPEANTHRRVSSGMCWLCRRSYDGCDAFVGTGYVFSNRNGNSYSVGKVTEYGLWPAQV